MEESISFKTSSFPNDPKITRILWKPKVHYCPQKPTMSLYWTTSIHTTLFHHISLSFIFILSSHLHLGFPSDVFLTDISNKNLRFQSLPMRTRCFPFTTRLWFYEFNNICLGLKIMKFSLFSFIKNHVTSFA